MKTKMPKTSTDRVARYRKRQAEQGNKEIRGIFAPADQHMALKEKLRKIIKRG